MKTDEVIEVVKQTLIPVLIVIIIACIPVVAYHFLVNTLDRVEIVECNVLKKDAEHYPTFFVSYGQHQMCTHYNFTFTGTEIAPIMIRDGQVMEAGLWYTPDGRNKIQYGNENTEVEYKDIRQDDNLSSSTDVESELLSE